MKYTYYSKELYFLKWQYLSHLSHAKAKTVGLNSILLATDIQSET